MYILNGSDQKSGGEVSEEREPGESRYYKVECERTTETVQTDIDTDSTVFTQYVSTSSLRLYRSENLPKAPD